MASITDLISKLNSLGLNEAPIEHPAAADVEQWKQHLSNISSLPNDYVLTKTLIFKPKQPKSEPLAPVMVVAKHDTGTNTKALGAELKLKDLRFANDEVLSNVFQTAKGSGKVFPNNCSHMVGFISR